MSTLRELIITDATQEDGTNLVEVEFYGNVDLIDLGEESNYNATSPTCSKVEWDEMLYSADVNAQIMEYVKKNNDNILYDIELDYSNSL